MSKFKTQNQEMFKDLSIENFWYPFTAVIFDNISIALKTGASDKIKTKQIITFFAELMWPLYKSTFKSKCKFIEYVNCTTLGILDAYERRFEIENIHDVFYIVKMNWNKNHKYITKLNDL